MAGPRGYSSYHGKGSKWKIVLAVLLVLVIVGALAVIRLQKYVVYDDSGHPHLDLSRFSGQQSDSSVSAPADGSGDADLTIQEPKQQSIQAVQLPAGPLTDWKAAWTSVSADGTYDAVVYTVKDADGSVYVDNQSAPPGAIRTVEGTGAAVGDMLKDSGVYTVAKIACFRDPVASNGDLEGMGLKNTGGYIFYDGDNDRWLDPAKPAARQYLIDLATACAAAGFDEILLTDVSYPTVGKLNKIDYGAVATGLPDSLKEELDSFLTQMKTALAEYDVKLSILLPSELIASNYDADGASGQSLADIAPLVDRVYANADQDQGGVNLLKANLAAVSKSTEFVPVLTGLEGLSSDSYLIVS